MSGDWIQTYTGRKFHPLTPDPEQIVIEDIAHALANLCRFNGHCLEFYSVAQHSVIVSQHVPDEHALWGLLHDAAEAYIGDLVRPLKHARNWCGDQFVLAEQSIMYAVADAFPLAHPWCPAEVHKADERALATEKRDLMGEEPGNWGLREPPFTEIIQPMYPPQAEALFLDRFEELTR